MRKTACLFMSVLSVLSMLLAACSPKPNKSTQNTTIEFQLEESTSIAIPLAYATWALQNNAGIAIFKVMPAGIPTLLTSLLVSPATGTAALTVALVLSSEYPPTAPVTQAVITLLNTPQSLAEGTKNIYYNPVTREMVCTLNCTSQTADADFIITRDQVQQAVNESSAKESNMPQPTPPGNTKFTPPDKDYCDEDIPRYFATLLANESAGRILAQAFRDKQVEIFDRTPLGKTANNIAKENNQFHQRMTEEKKCYFYERDGSIFMDYKIMRDAKFGDGELSAWINSNLNTNMTAEQMIQICLKQVTTWWP